jgi:hypothetical protein
MANRYVRSTDGNDADDGSTWALADATIGGSMAGDAAGDTTWLSDNHAESVAGAQTFACAGTVTTPSRILCGDDSAEPPTALATTATITSTSGGLTITGSFYCYGVAFITSTTFATNSATGATVQIYEACAFKTTAAGTTPQLTFGGTANNMVRVELLNCTLKAGGTANAINIAGEVVIRGGSFESGTAAMVSVFRPQVDRTHSLFDCSGFDFSNLGSSVNLFFGTGVASGRFVIRDCKLPASWSGSLVASGLVGMGERFEMYNCDSADTNYRLWVEDYAGSIKQETTIIRTGGASDGTTGLSWKMATSANAEYPTIKLESPEIHRWNSTLSAITVNVEIVHDTNVAGGQGAGTGSRFQDDEIWLEVMYLGTSGVPLGTWVRDCKADVLATASDQTDSSETWTTTGLTTPQKQALSVTFTPAEVGYIVARVVVAKASKTIYVCPKLTVA